MATRRDLFEIEAQVPRGTLVYIAPDRIEPNPQQPRQQLSRAGLEELKASIAARGILQALLGVRGESGRITLIAGHRRWQAAKELGLPRVPVILIDNRSGRSDQLIDAIIENVQRENLAPWEEGESYRQLAAEFGWDHKQIASTIGKSRPYVTQRIRAAENLAPIVKEFFLTGDQTLLNPERSPDKTVNEVTNVTPSDIIHNPSEEGHNKTLAGFLNNVELVRRLTALPAAKQIEAVSQSLALAKQANRSLNINDLTVTLKNFRDEMPSPKARLKARPARLASNKTGEKSDFDFELSELEVVQWSASAKIKTLAKHPNQEWQAVEIDRLIASYEQDLARLRSWKAQKKNNSGW